MTHAVHAEWTKLRSVPSCLWLVPAVVALTVPASLIALLAADTASCPTPSTCFEDTTRLSLTGVWLGQVAVVAMAALAIGDEHATGTIRVTLAAMPRRLEVLLAKAAVLTAAVVAAGSLAVLASFAAARFVLPANGFTEANGYPPLSLADGPTARAAVGTVLYLVLVALLALGVGTAVRETAVAVTAVLALLFLLPAILQLVADPAWRERMEQVVPTVALNVQATTRIESLPLPPWAGLGVLAGYAAGALALGGWLLVRRDA